MTQKQFDDAIVRAGSLTLDEAQELVGWRSQRAILKALYGLFLLDKEGVDPSDWECYFAKLIYDK